MIPCRIIMHRNVWVKLFSLGSFGLLTGSLQFHRVYTLSLEYFSSELGAMLLSLVIVLVLFGARKVPEIGASTNVLGFFGANILCHWDGTNQIVVREIE